MARKSKAAKEAEEAAKAAKEAEEAVAEPVEVPYAKADENGKFADSYAAVAGNSVLVYSKWPGTLRYDTPYGVCRILGLQERKVIGAPYMSSTIPVEAWNHIARVYGNTRMFKNHFIFAAKDAESGDAHARELSNEKTGVEPLEQGRVGVGIEPLKKD